MGFCKQCGEIVREPSGVCAPCGTKAVDAVGSGMSAKDNRGDMYSNAYLSNGLNAGVEKGLRKMLGDENTSVNEICIECGRKLIKHEDVFVGPTHAGEHVYCQGCYGKHFKKGDCEKCRKPVLGLGKEYVSQEGRIWHKECFDAGKSCAECSKVIFGQGVEALNKYYHPSCFKSLIDGSFLDFNGEPCCRPCHNKIKSARLSTAAKATPTSAPKTIPVEDNSAALREFAERKDVPDFHVRCDKCLEVVRHGGIQLPTGQLLHEACFTCSECGKGVNGKYIVDEDKIWHPESSTSAEYWWLVPTPVYNVSDVESPFLVALLNWMGACVTCFTCTTCKAPLAGQPFGDSPSGPTCESCLKKGGPRTFTPGFIVNQAGLKELRGPGGVKLGDNEALKSLGGSSTCPACGKAVYMSDQVPGPLNTKWHR
ncbi:hypothetical protein SpCBS45565_g03350 [Spizellomyces sp. 'palustris']|nr:hypothetical protein SpCBS45565_g03350 [Spizellomyces sp. 'palustris']